MIPPSEDDYTERIVASNNRMDIEMSNPSTDNMRYNMPQPLHDNNEAAPNTSCQINPSTMPILPLAILYEANVLADPNLWDSHFGPVSLFSTNEFLQSDV